jgi:hypothetical protein
MSLNIHISPENSLPFQLNKACRKIEVMAEQAYNF